MGFQYQKLTVKKTKKKVGSANGTKTKRRKKKNSKKIQRA